MVHSGYLRQDSVSFDRRVKRLELTERGLSLAHSFTVAMLRPLQLLSEKHKYEDVLHSDPRFIGNFYAEILRLYAEGGRFAPKIPVYSLFVDQNGGREILFILWLALIDAEAAGQRTVSCSYGEIARSLGGFPWACEAADRKQRKKRPPDHSGGRWTLRRVAAEICRSGGNHGSARIRACFARCRCSCGRCSRR